MFHKRNPPSKRVATRKTSRFELPARKNVREVPLNFPQGPEQIDISAERTEVEWLAASDRFWLTVTPKLFEWLGWIALLAGVTFVQKKTGSGVLSLFLGLCTASMLFYFFALFAKVEFTGFLTRHPKVQRAISISLSSLLAGGAWYLAKVSVDVLASANP